jgi:chemotaxis receptor (MCP) glutamine deamidase CheD
MQNLSAPLIENAPKEIRVGANECRLARQGERMVARGVLADVVVTIQVPPARFAAMLRFSVPDDPSASSLRLRVLLDFADQALALVFESVRSMDMPADAITVSVIGGADVEDLTYGLGGELAAAVEKSLLRQGVILNGSDLGGAQSRSIWLESSSGRLIVRSASLPSTAPPSTPICTPSAASLASTKPTAETSQFQPSVRRDAIA